MGELVTPGDIIAGKYRVERFLGRGGMGLVVAARHLDLHGLYAIKLMLVGGYDKRTAIDRFLREARTASTLKSQHVCQVFDFGRLDNGAVFMVMEHLEGSDLAGELARYGPLPVHEAARYILQACEALAEAHSCNIVHRDLKPANLFLTRATDGSPCVKVLDFGIAKLMAVTSTPVLTASEAMLGTPRYMAPEQIRAERHLDGRSDIWALGVSLYELVTGTHPFNGESVQLLLVSILANPPIPASRVAPALPAELDTVIFRCLEKQAVDRYQDVAAFARALLPFAPADAAPLVERVGRVLASAGGRRTVVFAHGGEALWDVDVTVTKRAVESEPLACASAPDTTPLSQGLDTAAERPPDASLPRDGTSASAREPVPEHVIVEVEDKKPNPQPPAEQHATPAAQARSPRLEGDAPPASDRLSGQADPGRSAPLPGGYYIVSGIVFFLFTGLAVRALSPLLPDASFFIRVGLGLAAALVLFGAMRSQAKASTELRLTGNGSGTSPIPAKFQFGSAAALFIGVLIIPVPQGPVQEAKLDIAVRLREEGGNGTCHLPDGAAVLLTLDREYRAIASDCSATIAGLPDSQRLASGSVRLEASPYELKQASQHYFVEDATARGLDLIVIPPFTQAVKLVDQSRKCVALAPGARLVARIEDRSLQASVEKGCFATFKDVPGRFRDKAAELTVEGSRSVSAEASYRLGPGEVEVVLRESAFNWTLRFGNSPNRCNKLRGAKLEIKGAIPGSPFELDVQISDCQATALLPEQYRKRQVTLRLINARNCHVEKSAHEAAEGATDVAFKCTCHNHDLKSDYDC